MTEWPSRKNKPESLTEYKVIFEAEKVRLATEIIQEQLSFPFPGITENAIFSIRANHDEFPEYADSVEEVLAKFTNKQITITMGNGNKNPVVIPVGSTDAISDSIPLKDLIITEGMNPKLEQLIELDSMLTTIGNIQKSRK